jgi:hypothetical protein
LQVARYPAEADLYYRIRSIPIPFVVYVQAFEQISTTLKQRLQGGNKHTLPKAPQPGEKVIFTVIDQTLYLFGLINVQIVIAADLFKGLNSDGEFL